MEKNRESRKKLTEQQIKAARLSITTPMTQSQIGTAVGVSRETICLWFKQPHIKAYKEEIQEVLERDTEEYIIKVYEDIRHVLYQIVIDKKEGSNNRIKASETLFKAAGMFKQKMELEVNDTRKKLNEWLDEDAVEKLIEDTNK